MMGSANTDDAGYTATTLNPNFLRVLCTSLQDEGAPTARFFTGTGLVAADLAKPEVKVSFRQAQTVIRRTLQWLDRAARPDFGLQFADRLTVSSYGALGMAMLSCSNVEEAVRVGIRYRRASGVMVDPVLKVDGQEFVLAYTEPYPDPESSHFHYEAAVACAVDFFRVFGGPRFAPLRLEFAYPQPAWADRYRSRFKCPLVFDAPRTRLVAERSWLALPLETHDPLTELQILATMQPAEPTGEADDFDIAESIRAMLRRDPTHPLHMREVAAGLNMTDRTLRRHLARKGLSFRDICDRVRKTMALELLRQPRVTAEEVAYSVGFAGSRNFRRAVKRWTGRTPGALKGDKSGA